MMFQMIKYGIQAGLLLLTVLAAGCINAPEPEFRQLPPESELVRKRAAEVAALWSRDAIRSVLLRKHDMTCYRNDLPRLTERFRALKVNHACLAVESLQSLKSGDERESLTAMISALTGAGIRCDIVIPQHLFPARRSATVFHRAFNDSIDPMDDVISRILQLKKYLPENVPAPGIMVWAGIHRFTRNNEQLPPGTMYRWDENNYGAGSDNDKMMHQLLQNLADWQKAAHAENLRFTAAIPVFYHEKARAGQLTKGLVKDFLAVADTVLVIGYGEKPSEYLRSLQGVLQENNSGRILCGMVLSGHMSESVGALRRRSWQDFFKILTVMHRSCGSKPGYGGMVLIPWQSVELLQER